MDDDLDEVVVVGYGTKKKQNMTGAVGSYLSKGIGIKTHCQGAARLTRSQSRFNIPFGNGTPEDMRNV